MKYLYPLYSELPSTLGILSMFKYMQDNVVYGDSQFKLKLTDEVELTVLRRLPDPLGSNKAVAAALRGIKDLMATMTGIEFRLTFNARWKISFHMEYSKEWTAEFLLNAFNDVYTMTVCPGALPPPDYFYGNAGNAGVIYDLFDGITPRVFDMQCNEFPGHIVKNVTVVNSAFNLRATLKRNGNINNVYVRFDSKVADVQSSYNTELGDREEFVNELITGDIEHNLGVKRATEPPKPIRQNLFKRFDQDGSEE